LPGEVIIGAGEAERGETASSSSSRISNISHLINRTTTLYSIQDSMQHNNLLKGSTAAVQAIYFISLIVGFQSSKP